jgi:hypothetical protein
MPHLLTFRKGWENERLAAYLLSRISFVAHPTSSADDLGSDFFCTIFEAHSVSGQDALLPRISFAIQVKSSTSEIPADNKIEYLTGLELPFFIGVVSQSPAEMKIYSAELLPLLFAEEGVPAKLSLAPIPAEEFDPNNYYERKGTQELRLRCPLVTTIGVDDDRPAIAKSVYTLLRICKRARANIATRLNEEHIYDVDGFGLHKIVAGSGSALHFRFNFLKRLGEVFLNISQLIGEAPPVEVLMTEFRAYESLYLELQAINQAIDHGPLPEFVTIPYNVAKAKMSTFSS